ncbi:MAG: pyridoxamine 5'-phosphate oxidase family protein, partial [Desulfobacterales bacterium]|nr:pyridoxamine 5'-phosphate oxidase family protein [Desulfobacterales bacterium]
SGRAEFIRESQAKRDALDVIMAQYSDETFGSYEYPDKFLKMVAVIKVKIQEMTGKRSGF